MGQNGVTKRELAQNPQIEKADLVGLFFDLPDMGTPSGDNGPLRDVLGP